MSNREEYKNERLVIILGFIVLMTVLLGFGFRHWVVDRNNNEEQTTRTELIQKEKTERTKKRAEAIRSIVPWSKDE